MSEEKIEQSPSSSSASRRENLSHERKNEMSGGSSGKRKHQEKSDALLSEENTLPATKRRRTGWPEESQCRILGPLHLPDLLHAAPINDQESLKLNQRLYSINRRLSSHASSADRCRLLHEKQEVIEELIRKNPNFSPQSGKNKKKKKLLKKKLYIPMKRFPHYNFFGLIIGPRGRTQKRLERETGARIQLRGRGCHRKNSRQEEEDPHVLVEAESQRSLDAAASMVEKLLVPISEGINALKRAQLRELAELNRVQERRFHAYTHF